MRISGLALAALATSFAAVKREVLAFAFSRVCDDCGNPKVREGEKHGRSDLVLGRI